MFRFPPAADRFLIGDQSDRGPLLQVIEIIVCGIIGHKASVLHYARLEVEEVYDSDEMDWVQVGRDVEEPYLGCIRCLAEVELPLPPPVPVDIVDWE
ncbi:hypothetical protein [Microbacterium sp.]|uniref:hypothetical protein n=1 Tax=Microbacterium sp. TaxID=51671 RepID=UPI002C46FAF8|nr:hypothetical protein [Microbacterium sp.]HWL78045.1 hypothetical protein [Microbacterium sp.]